MSTLILHEDVGFRGQTIYVTGHAYRRCTFEGCTLVMSGPTTGLFEGCGFSGCAWHLNIVVHDSEHWDAFMADTAPLITKSLPRSG